MRIKIILYATVIIVVLCQQYPPCPGASPLDLGNATDSYNKHILELSSFLHSDDKSLELAFEGYLKNGDQSEVTKYMGKQKFFYVIITVSLSLVSLVLFIILLKMGNINFTEKQLFQKIKQKGYSSPISAFFTLSAVILLAFTTFNGFLIPFMISDIKATQCRLDAVSSVFIKGSSQYDWDGVQKYIDKLEILSNFTIALQQSLRNTPNYQLTLNYTEYSSIYLKEGLILYKGIKDSYKNSQIVYNSTERLSLQSLIPNLFVSTANKKAILQDLQFYMSTLTSALDTYKHIQYSLNQSHERLNSSLWFFNKSSLQLNDIKQTYQIVMNNFRARIDPYFSSAQYTLIISEIITAFSFVGCLVSIITIRLIQANFDYFSLRIYKVIWAAHIIVFCLNLVFLLIVNQVLLYSEGACNVSYEILTNDTKAQQLIPSIKFYSAQRAFYFCVNSSDDFSVQAQIQSDFAHINYLINLKQKLSDDYSINTISSYSSILDLIRINITAYKIGIEGNYSLLDSQLTKMNNILMNDPYNQYCFKHHWQYSPSDCGKNQTTIVLPRYRFPNRLNSSNFGSSRADCYVLSSYDEFRPIFIKQTQFILLYQNYLGYCNNSIENLAVASDCFFRTQMKKQNILENLISQLSKLESYLYNSSYYIAKFISNRGSFFKKVFQNLSPNTNTLFIKKGNDCGIIHAYVNGIYNQFCVNFRAKGRQIFLITFLNIAFSIFLILLSFLYSLQLRSLNEQSIDLQYSERIKFEKTQHEIQSNSSTSQLKSHSSGSEEHRSG